MSNLKADTATGAHNAWAFPPQQPLRVLAVRGLWYGDYGVDRALARLGGARVIDSWHRPGALRFYPTSNEQVMANHLVVVGNVDAGAFAPAQMNFLKEYVRHGGGLLLLGGNFGCADYHGSGFEEMSPVAYPEKDALIHDANGLTLSADIDVATRETSKLSAEMQPRIYWYHKITPKPGAKVIATAGGQPMLVTGSYGNGRVAVFAGTLLGDPAANQLPFWQWNQWPSILASTISWLTEPTAHPDTNQYAEIRTEFSTRMKAVGGKHANEQALLREFALCCCDREAARLLLDNANQGLDDLDADTMFALADEVRPWVNADFAPLSKSMIASGLPCKAALGLRVLGQSKAPDARDTLEKALESGEVEGDAPDNGLAPETAGAMGPEQKAYAIRLGAVEGLGNLGDAASIPKLRKTMQQFHKAEPERGAESAPSLSPDTELYEEAAISALRCGDSDAAGPAIEALLGMRYRFFHIVVALEQPEYEVRESTKLMKKRAAADILRQQAREQYGVEKLRGLPASVLPAVAQRLSSEADPRAAVLAFAAFEKRPVPATVATILRGSANKALADIAEENSAP